MRYAFVFSWFLFFKQKTAYEMRISDWSSDVCSSDLVVLPLVQHAGGVDVAAVHAEGVGVDDQLRPAVQSLLAELEQRQAAHRGQQGARGGIEFEIAHRSEEHTSELQSLMRISYAGFCLKKKKKKKPKRTIIRVYNTERRRQS